MKKAAIIVLILLVILGGAYLLIKKAPQSVENKVSTTQSKNSIQSKSPQVTLKSLLTSGKSQKCTYSSGNGATTTAVTIYIADGKMKADSISTSGETKTVGHVLISGGYSYMWIDTKKQGFKVAVNQEKQQVSVTPANNQVTDTNQKLPYTCEGWTKDSSVFVLPSDVTFSTPAIPTQNSSATSSGLNVNSPGCSACDNLPAGTAKDTCKAQLHCQ